MDFKNGQTLLIVVAIVVFIMIYTIGAVWDFFSAAGRIMGPSIWRQLFIATGFVISAHLITGRLR